MQRARRLSDQRGAAMVEMIIVLPILLFVVFAIVELSRGYYTLQLATAAIRDGARAAAVAAPPSSNVRNAGIDRINDILQAGGITTSSQGAWVLPGTPDVTLQVITEPPCPTPPPPLGCDQEVRATVTVRFTTLFPFLPASLNNLDLVQEARMRWEGG